MLLLFALPAGGGRRADAEELEALLAEVAAGDRDALAALYGRTRTAVHAMALSLLKNPHDADDVVQDTFVRVWERAEQYNPQGTPLAWILAVARNLTLMRLREQGRTVWLEPEDWQALPAEAEALTPEDRAVLTAAFTVLEEQERQIVLLHVTAGLKHRETASLLSLPLATVLSKYSRAMKKLKNTLKGAWTE